ncbi:MAG: hypothetical protein E6Q97_36635 [Desulfurellales bacterium]|nr:MAG: hypothetical protein E6Q97_36635 [Desulfurellales bacterium]
MDSQTIERISQALTVIEKKLANHLPITDSDAVVMMEAIHLLLGRVHQVEQLVTQKNKQITELSQNIFSLSAKLRQGQSKPTWQ